MEFVLPVDLHNRIVEAAYRRRGFTAEEATQAARFCQMASWHGIKTHNAIKALHLDDHFGSGNKRKPGCVPGAAIDKLPSKYKAAQKWNANRKLGQAVAFEAMDAAMSMADEFGVGIVSVDHAFHYLWGGGYVMYAAKKGYIAYTGCTAALAEVVPFGGKFPTLGTNPHSWAFPTTDAIGFPIVIDWATSTVAMGRVQQFVREGKPLPPGSAVDKDGKETTDASKVAALLTFGGHKGYGLSLIDELTAAYIGGSLPTLRSRPEQAGEGEKTTPNFFFQAIRPEAMDCAAFAGGRNQAANVKAVIQDVLGHGNAPPEGRCILPGQIEHDAAVRSEKAGGLIFTEAEIEQFRQIGADAGVALEAKSLKQV
ncbi:MAG: Ldh family oxidoreductase [Phycisphaeraceae bacterium]